MLNNKFITACFILVTLLILKLSAYAEAAPEDLVRLQQAYPEHIQTITEQAIIWRDGEKMPLKEGLLVEHYQPGIATQLPQTDPGRLRYEPFFRKMYGNTKSAVTANLTIVYWMPKYFQYRYPLLVTTVNNVDKKLQRISVELENLVASKPDYLAYLKHPGGTFKWRAIAHTNKLSPHSFGISIDINVDASDYWQWDLIKAGKPVSEYSNLDYQNRIPWDIVLIFEKYGFIWGGKWKHYDTMHFEYRPELLK